MAKPNLADIVHDANDRLGDCRGAVEMAVQSMLESSDPEHAQACAIGALTLAVKEIKRIQEDLDEASSKAGRAQALKLLPKRAAEVAHG
jgi:hypothetical protein